MASDNRLRFTPRAIATAPHKAHPYELADTEVPGLICRVQPLPSTTKTFYVQWGRGKRKKVSRFGVYTIEQVRLKARRMLLEAEEHGEPLTVSTARAETFGQFYREHYKP